VAFFHTLSPWIPLDFVEKYKTTKLTHRCDTADNLIKTMPTIVDPLASPTDITDCQK
jgi:hypothetical protein